MDRVAVKNVGDKDIFVAMVGLDGESAVRLEWMVPDLSWS
jgi:hypothetical protein